jgi:hypothetical protein
VFYTTQLTRQAAKKGADVDASEIAEDYNKVRICDVLLLIYETIDLALQNQIAIKIGKNRDGLKPPEGIVLLVDKGRMSFYNLDGTEGGYPELDKLKLNKAILVPKKNAVLAVKKHSSALRPKKEAIKAAA